MKITLDINDSRSSFFMEMLKDLDFVKVVSKDPSAGEAGNENKVSEPPMTHYASEKMLSKDWLTPEEDKAWKDL